MVELVESILLLVVISLRVEPVLDVLSSAVEVLVIVGSIVVEVMCSVEVVVICPSFVAVVLLNSLVDVDEAVVPPLVMNVDVVIGALLMVDIDVGSEVDDRVTSTEDVAMLVTDTKVIDVVVVTYALVVKVESRVDAIVT